MATKSPILIALFAGAAAGAAALAGCNGGKLNALPETNKEIFYQGGQTPPVDILWVVDNSPSMCDKQQKLSANFHAFMQYFAALNLDFHLAIITTDTYQGNGMFQGTPAVIDKTTPNYEAVFASNVIVGCSGSNMERGLQAARSALDTPATTPFSGDYDNQTTYPNGVYGIAPNINFLRPNAVLAIIIVSDEDDQSLAYNTPQPIDKNQNDDPAWRAVNLEAVTAGNNGYGTAGLGPPLIDFFTALKGGQKNQVIINSIVGDVPTGCSYSGGFGALPGTRYALATSYYGGLQQSVCAADFGPILNDIGSQVAGLVSGFQLQFAPDPTTITVKVNGAIVPEDPNNGWYLVSNPATNTYTIQFAPAATPPPCAVIEVTYSVKGTSTSGSTIGHTIPTQCTGIAPVINATTLDGGAVSCDLADVGKAVGGSVPALAALLAILTLVFKRRRA